jgi:gliding motility-associated protein GldC
LHSKEGCPSGLAKGGVVPLFHLLLQSYQKDYKQKQMHKSNISIEIELDDSKVPQQIQWTASDSSADMMQPAKSMMVAFWDGADKSALRIDLWTKDMMVDEMADFYYQTMMGMADTYLRATQQKELVDDMKNFAKEFYKKFKDSQLKENK